MTLHIPTPTINLPPTETVICAVCDSDNVHDGRCYRCGADQSRLYCRTCGGVQLTAEDDDDGWEITVNAMRVPCDCEQGAPRSEWPICCSPAAWAEAALQRLHHAETRVASDMIRNQLDIAHRIGTGSAFRRAASEIRRYGQLRVQDDLHGGWEWIAGLAETTGHNAVAFDGLGF